MSPLQSTQPSGGSLRTLQDESECTSADAALNTLHGSNGSRPHSSQPTDSQPTDKPAAIERAAARGWTKPIPYTYAAADAGAADGDENEPPVTAIPEPAWLSDAAKYEWSDEFGEVGPVNAALERELFHRDELMKAGVLTKAYEFDVTVEGPVQIQPVRDFDDAGLHPIMRENVRLCHYNNPTPIQSYCIPAILLGNDVVACAQTGSGKTAAYLIPILSKLMGKARQLSGHRPNPHTYNSMTDRVRAEPLVLIVCPTRELACQIFDEARRLCYRTMLRPCVVYGGAPTKNQREELEKGCDILVATPGRLVDFMSKSNLLSLARLKFTVIDEADEMLQDDWEDTISKIFVGKLTISVDANEDADHMYLMFSATFPKAARELARNYMADDYVRIRVGRVGSTHGNIKQNIVWVEDSEKRKALYDLMFSLEPNRTLIFVNGKREADLVDDYLYNLGLPSTSIHSDRTQREREDALRAFKGGSAPILVATGVTARGLDINHITHVINYDLPSGQHGGIDEYVHRIGRTARIGNEGLATSFYNTRNEDIADDLVKILVEAKQEVPDFLQDRIPEQVTWDDDTDHEGEGSTRGDNAACGAIDESGFAAGNDFVAATGFTADGDFAAYTRTASPAGGW
ncbi:DEAD/DEAH box RNA helicase [Lepidopterella palustris CBS 459.81]|uniref:RNA helicase n=1 Tax=Lepidopterella palustris CBS 459.81 TaxID=1314670 RepID=A0A8E2EBH9_9PEZI|nr:DEAD/DEAH box RNA helicase [Lepidopterella palustris CBS 459.81]